MCKQKLWGAGSVRKQRALLYRENRADVQKHRDKRGKIVTMASLVFEGVSVLNSSPIEDCTANDREPQKGQERGRISLCHLIQCYGSPAIAPAALADNPHLQWLDSLRTQRPWEWPQCLQLGKSRFCMDSSSTQSSVEFFHLETEMRVNQFGPFYVLEQLGSQQASLASYHGHHCITIIGARQAAANRDLTGVYPLVMASLRDMQLFPLPQIV